MDRGAVDERAEGVGTVGGRAVGYTVGVVGEGLAVLVGVGEVAMWGLAVEGAVVGVVEAVGVDWGVAVVVEER